MNSYFNTKNGLFLRDPDGGVESVDLMKNAGWDFIACNVEPAFPPEKWEEKVIPKAESVGMAYMPWQYIWNYGDLDHLLSVADDWSNGVCIVNTEKELDTGVITPKGCADKIGDRDVAISTIVWLYNGVDWRPFAKYPVMLQHFPFETGVWDWQGCEKHARDMGIKCVLFTVGSYDVAGGPHSGGKAQPEPGDYEAAFAKPITIYTADDLTGSEFPVNYPEAYRTWMPTASRTPCPTLPPLNAAQCPYTGPYYMAGQKYKRIRGKTVKALKIAMTRLGIRNFTNPTTYYGVELGKAMEKWKVTAGLAANPNYGIPSWDALRSATTKNGEYAFDQEALQLIREDFEAMQNG
jgi:hypothetical protein